MAYPTFEQYNNAFQVHRQLLTDPELRTGDVAKTGLGIPLAISGGFALTYTIKSGTKKYAVRCFHRESKALERRYNAIAKKLVQLRSSYFLDFQFQADGIRIDGGSFPIVKMAWAQGETLGEFIESNRGRKGGLASLPAALQTMSAFLEKEGVAHGDMSPGNIMVSKGGAIQLIDYDGMFVEEIRDIGSSELGNINFQHPGRSQSNPFSPTMDRFSLIVLSLSIKALNEDPSLWDKTKSDIDGIVFRANDYIDPASSQVFSALIAKPSLVTLAQRFAAICKAPLEKTPCLEDFLAGRNIPATVIQITTVPQNNRLKPGYRGVYNVLDAMSYEMCLRSMGDKVEVIGQVIEVKQGKAINGKPYIFINFGPWRGRIFKISIWSEGLEVISKKPDDSWVGQWISVVGLMEPPYENRKHKYSHLSINVTSNGQMSIISEAEAKFRLTTDSQITYTSPASNKQTLEIIKDRDRINAPSVNNLPRLAQSPSASNKDVLNNIREKNKQPPKATSTPPKQQPSQQVNFQRPMNKTEEMKAALRRLPNKPPEKSFGDKFLDFLGRIFK